MVTCPQVVHRKVVHSRLLRSSHAYTLNESGKGKVTRLPCVLSFVSSLLIVRCCGCVCSAPSRVDMVDIVYGKQCV